MANPGQGLQKNTAPYLQARSNGFGAPGQARPQTKTEELTDRIDDQVLEHVDPMAAMALQALTDGMRARDIKTRIDAAKAFLHNFHNPTKQMDLNVTEQVTITHASREAEDKMTEEERALVDAVEARLIEMRDEVVHDAVVLGEEYDEPEPVPAAPATPQSGWDAPVLPPLPPEGRDS